MKEEKRRKGRKTRGNEREKERKREDLSPSSSSSSSSLMSVAANKLLLLPRSQELLRALSAASSSSPAAASTSLLWKYFLFCTETPRVSGNLAAITEKIRLVAKDLGCQFTVDSIGNVILKKPASKGLDHLPAVCIQAHMDMVCSKNNDSSHNFEVDPIVPRIEGDWLKATGTTLGADDGIGVAACLALLEDSTFTHPPLECLLTVDEETDMSGAEKLDSSVLQAKYLINVDSEEQNSICFGCAGGFEKEFCLPVTRILPEKPHNIFQINVSGLVGGHSGAQIHEGLGNAIQFMVRILREYAVQDPEFFLLGLDAGTAINTIPRECSAIVGLPASHSHQLREALEASFEEIVREYKVIEKQAKLTIENAQSDVLHAHDDPRPCDHRSSLAALDFLAAVPHGVIRMSPDVPGLVETSNCLSIARLKRDHLFVHVFARSSSETQMKMVDHHFDSLARLAGVINPKTTNKFPGWLPDPQSKALAVVKKTQEEVLKVVPKVYAVHAGLECGLIKNRYPNMDCVSIGPEIRDAHTPDERLLISSVPPFITLLKGTLEAFAKGV